MASKKLVGPTPTDPQDVQRRADTLAQLNTGISRGYVDGRAAALAASKATKTYVDNQDGTFELISYYQAQDNLNIPLTSKGQPNGVASLDGSGKIPSAQIPALGAGVIKGPFGATSTFDGTTGATPVKLVEWNIGVEALNFRPMVYLSALVTATNGGRPRIECRIGTPAQTTYASQTLVAAGMGRTNYNDYGPVAVVPVPDVLNAMQDGVQTYWPSSMDIRITAWLFNARGTGTVATQTGLIATATVFLARVAT